MITSASGTQSRWAYQKLKRIPFLFFKVTAALIYPLALASGADAMVSLKRIEDFLLQEEKDKKEIKSPKMIHEVKESAIELNQVSARWRNDSDIETLSRINLKIKAGQFCAVVGPVGSGKVRQYYNQL